MNYQKLACWGDSQTYGARSYGCYPLYLARFLNERTQYVWQTLNCGVNGFTVRDLWFRISEDTISLSDVYQACILIGANDVGNESSLDLFEEYYRQILSILRINRFKVAYCGEIPPIIADGHVFFSKSSAEQLGKYNERIRRAVSDSGIGRLVEFPELSAADYADPVHLNESGNIIVAECYAQAIQSF